jgi:hypothetical protein
MTRYWLTKLLLLVLVVVLVFQVFLLLLFFISAISLSALRPKVWWALKACPRIAYAPVTALKLLLAARRALAEASALLYLQQSSQT